MRNYIIATLLAGAVATPAIAQPVGPATGLRVEGIVGYDTADVEGENAEGVLYGAGVGYDFQAGSAVFGVEGEVTDTTADECVADVDFTGDELCAQMGRDLYVGARAGTLVGRNTLLYAKAGYTNARVAVDYDDGTTGTADDFELGTSLDGVRVGAGAEFGIGPNSYVKTEYRYSNYEQGFEKHQVVAGFGFRF